MDTNEDLFAEEGEELDLEVEENEEQRDEDEENAEEDAVKKVVKPKRVLRPRPKLNEETLKSSRGLTALESYFERVKFKGRGREEEDLGVILKTYEYWCHRLFPKYPFEECIAKIEHLGAKRAVVTHLKKMRLDMLVEDTPIVNESESEPEEIINLFDATPSDPPAMSEEQMEIIRLNKERAERIRREREQERLRLIGENPMEVVQSQSDMSVSQREASDLPADQMERIRINRERAERLRRERLEREAMSSVADESVTKSSEEVQADQQETVSSVNESIAESSDQTDQQNEFPETEEVEQHSSLL